MADVAAKKRRLARELGEDTTDDVIEENASKANEFMLVAQNRALATRMFIFRRRTATATREHAAAAHTASILCQFVSVASRRLAQVRSFMRPLRCASHNRDHHKQPAPTTHIRRLRATWRRWAPHLPPRCHHPHGRRPRQRRQRH